MIGKRNGESREAVRQKGMALFRSENAMEKKEGLALLLNASRLGDKEAADFVAELIIRGSFYLSSEIELPPSVMKRLQRRANHGDLRARSLMNDYCLRRYKKLMGKRLTAPTQTGPLVGFDGKKIKIKRKGVFTPVDAILSYENGVNRLDLKLCVCYPQEEFGGVADLAKLKRTVLEGMHMWQGTYTVFGGQRLKVVVDVKEVPICWDSIFVTIVTKTQKEKLLKRAEKRPNILKARFLEDNRSFTTIFRKNWSVRGIKSMYLCSDDPAFRDYGELRQTVKHEFGHLLGLGDLYRSETDGLPGVAKGTYAELDGYYVMNGDYNLVMSDHRGPITDNDIEMVVLAFQKNKMQHYQKQNKKDKISEALGKGN